MKKTFISTVAAFAVAMLFTTCTKPPNYPIEPVISFISYSIPKGRQDVDTIYIKIAFTDGDGDLGPAPGDTVPNMILRNPFRPLNPEPFTFPFVPEQGVGNGIKGEAIIKEQIPCCHYLGCDSDDPDHEYDTLQLELTIRDRKGNLSNTLKLPPLYSRCIKR